MKIGMFAMADMPTGWYYEAVCVPTETVQSVAGPEVHFVQHSEAEFGSPKSKPMLSRRAGPECRAESTPATGQLHLAAHLQRHR